MNRRRILLASTGVGLFAVAVGSVAQTPNRLRRIGLLAAGSPHPKIPAPVEALREALYGLGYIEGRTIEIEYRWAEGKVDRLPELAAELVRLRVELIVAAGDAPTRAAKAATSTLPIVMATSGDAVGAGFVASLARPGGNVTGMTAINPELGAKRLQLLRELQPQALRIAVLGNPGDASHAIDLRASQDASREIDITLVPIDMRTVDAVDGAFEQILRSKAGALVVFNDSTTVEARPRIVQLAAQYRIPAMYEAREWAAAGGLVAYGVTHVDLFRQSAAYVDKILRGAKPVDLPVEQPTRLRLTINLSAAKALGIMIPQSVLIRADEVIE